VAIVVGFRMERTVFLQGSSRGVAVKSGRSVPSRFTTGISPAIGISAATVGVVVSAVGLVAYTNRADAPRQRQRIAADDIRNRFPAPRPGDAGPPVPPRPAAVDPSRTSRHAAYVPAGKCERNVSSWT